MERGHKKHDVASMARCPVYPATQESNRHVGPPFPHPPCALTVQVQQPVHAPGAQLRGSCHGGVQRLRAGQAVRV